MSADLARGLRLAVGTLTMVPVGPVGDTTRPVARWAMLLAPVAVLPLALGAGLTAWLGALVALPPLATAALVLTALALGSRMMHLDGLADTADGIGAGWDRERALEVMRRGDVGPMGAVTVGLTLLLQAACLAAVVALPRGWALAAVAVVASRAALAVACMAGVPAARPTGLGAVVAGSVPAPATVALAIVAAAATALVGRWAGLPWWQGGVAVVAGLCCVAALLRICRRVFGGVTGDVMGASIEASLTVTLLVLAAEGAS